MQCWIQQPDVESNNLQTTQLSPIEEGFNSIKASYCTPISDPKKAVFLYVFFCEAEG